MAGILRSCRALSGRWAELLLPGSNGARSAAREAALALPDHAATNSLGRS